MDFSFFGKLQFIRHDFCNLIFFIFLYSRFVSNGEIVGNLEDGHRNPTNNILLSSAEESVTEIRLMLFRFLVETLTMCLITVKFHIIHSFAAIYNHN